LLWIIIIIILSFPITHDRELQWCGHLIFLLRRSCSTSASTAEPFGIWTCLLPLHRGTLSENAQAFWNRLFLPRGLPVEIAGLRCCLLFLLLMKIVTSLSFCRRRAFQALLNQIASFLLRRFKTSLFVRDRLGIRSYLRYLDIRLLPRGMLLGKDYGT